MGNDDKVVNQEKIDDTQAKSEYNIVEDDFKEIVDRSAKAPKLSDNDIKKLLEEASERINFLKNIENLNLKFNTYVIFTDGNDQLIYENGEFFIVSTTDSKSKKVKKKKSEAKDMYIEYFIKYQLNPIINQRNLNNMVKTVSKDVEKPLRNSRDLNTKVPQKNSRNIKSRVEDKISERNTKEKEETSKKEITKKKAIDDDLIR